MIHDREILDALADFPVETFSGVAYRATKKSLDSLTSSTNGGRWMRRGEASVLYTALSRDGAIAELTYRWGMLTPQPSGPAAVSELKIDLESSIRIVRANFEILGIDEKNYAVLHYTRMQEIGAAAAFLELHGIIVPSARWQNENLIVFTDNLGAMDSLEVVKTEDVDWQAWGKENGLLDG